MSTEQLSLADALEAATDSETADNIAERELDEPETKAELRARAASHAADVAGEHFPELPVESINWETSTQMQRSAGKAGYNQTSGQTTIRLSWDAYREYGWQKFARTVRHELIHAYQFHKHGEADHGPTFTRWIDPLDTDRHCERFADPKYWIVCDDCEKRNPRYQRSKIVKNPGNYRCQCGGDLRVEDA